MMQNIMLILVFIISVVIVGLAAYKAAAFAKLLAGRRYPKGYYYGQSGDEPTFRPGIRTASQRMVSEEETASEKVTAIGTPERVTAIGTSERAAAAGTPERAAAIGTLERVTENVGGKVGKPGFAAAWKKSALEKKSYAVSLFADRIKPWIMHGLFDKPDRRNRNVSGSIPQVCIGTARPQQIRIKTNGQP